MRERVEAILADCRIQRAFRFLTDNEPKIEADQIRFTLIPSPPFEEAERAAAFNSELRALGMKPVVDAVGNVIAPYEQFGPSPVAVCAHLDTVFPASTPLDLRRRGRTLYLPGISDNGSGIVALLWVLRAARNAGLRFRRPVIAIANVGEEGEGNLRGVRHLFNAPPWENHDCEFVAVDGGGMQRITHQAVGSRRLRVRVAGPGGHSWADFGRPNPVHTMATAIHQFTAHADRRPGTSFNVGVMHAGISVNAIPSEAVMEVDLRSVAPANLDQLDKQLRQSIAQAVGSTGLEYKVEIMGERPSGMTPATLPIVQAAVETTRYFGIEPQLDMGSTDANIPMSLGIPAIAIGAGGSSGNIHTPEEWFDPTQRDTGLQRLLALIAVLGIIAE